MAFGGEYLDGVGDRAVVSAVSVHEDDRCGPARRADHLDDDVRHHLDADRQGSGEAIVLTARGDGERRADENIHAADVHRVSEGDGDARVGVEREVRSVLLG